MRGPRHALALAAGALLFAAVMALLMAAPGFLSDRDSLVPVAQGALEAGR